MTICAGMACIAFAAIAAPAARASDATVDAMGNTFVSQLPSGWVTTRGGWQYIRVADCFGNAGNCFGNNPSDQYGVPTLPLPRGPSAMLQLASNQALVIFMKTPPSMRYFGFTQYLFSRPGQTYPLFASLSDSLNLLKFSSLQSPAPGQNIFDQYAVVVWTGDMNTFNNVAATLAKQGIARSRINFIPAPIGLPLNMGIGNPYDTFVMMMRTSIPDVQAKLDAYLNAVPFYVVRTGPATSTPVSAAPTIGYASDTSGVSEDPNLRTALNRLINDVKTRYASQYVFRDIQTASTTLTGWDCINRNITCNADSHDVLYSTTPTIQVAHGNDIAIVAGVNHHALNKALYINQVVNDPNRRTGIVAVDDRALTSQSALYHAGVTSPTDARNQTYQNLYAYAISYNCAGLQYCLTIPAPTASNPVGLQTGAPFAVSGRAYVDPHTDVRPSLQEIILQKVTVGTHK